MAAEVIGVAKAVEAIENATAGEAGEERGLLPPLGVRAAGAGAAWTGGRGARRAPVATTVERRTAVHELTTERLTLTPVRPSDHAVLLEHWRRPPVRAFLFDDEPIDAERVTAMIEDSERTFAAEGYGLWTMRLRRDDRFAGTAGLARMDDLDELEILYALEPELQGRGLATEAARAVLTHALETLGRPRVIAEIDETNRASIAVATRLGLRRFATVQGRLGPLLRYTT